MTKRNKNNDKSRDPAHFLDDHQRRFVLQSLGQYRSEEWIIAELKERWGIVRTKETIRVHYKYNKQYESQIDTYRKRWNSQVDQEPLNSKKFCLNLLYECIQESRARGDAKGVAALFKQATEITGMRVPEEIEVSHHHTGDITFEAQLQQLTQNPQLPPPEVLALHQKTMAQIPATIDVKPEPQ